MQNGKASEDQLAKNVPVKGYMEISLRWDSENKGELRVKGCLSTELILCRRDWGWGGVRPWQDRVNERVRGGEIQELV